MRQEEGSLEKEVLEEVTVAEPAMTTTTTLSAARSVGDLEEEEEVAMVDNDEEEEEVLDQNILTDEETGEDGKSEGEGGAGRRSVVNGKESLLSVALSNEKKRKSEGRQLGENSNLENPPHKRNRVLSVHFEDDVICE